MTQYDLYEVSSLVDLLPDWSVPSRFLYFPAALARLPAPEGNR